jgi:DNA-binding PadR family transcriptional regulator
VSVSMSILAILDARPSYGLQLKNEFEARTGGVWPLNVGQVYATLARLERDGLVRPSSGDRGETQIVYEITDAGRDRVASWFSDETRHTAPARDELVLKLVMASAHPDVNAVDVIQTERRVAVQLLQEYTRIKSGEGSSELGWDFLLDSLIFQTEARVRWLDTCEARLGRAGSSMDRAPDEIANTSESEKSEVRP